MHGGPALLPLALRLRASVAVVCLLALSPGANAWPNGPDDDAKADQPNDPGYGGQWNLWSWVPDEWSATEGFREEEKALGTGMHADRAWQITTGDRRVIVAVLDSGVYWDNKDLVNKYFLNQGELQNCKPTPLPGGADAPDAFDVDASGWFDIRDYYAAVENEAAALPQWDAAGNNNGMLDPQDLIIACSDGIDDDGNGYTDDISGWDFFADDNDAYDDNRFGHGNGEAQDSVAEGNNGMGGIGVCPDCTALMLRAADSFVADANEFAHSVAFAVDSGASVIQEALGSVNNTALARTAIDYAYANNVVVIASAADELSFHHNFPGTNNHTVYVHAIMYDGISADQSTTFLNFNNCTNFGMNLALSTPGKGCSSEAVGVSAGHAGLIYAAGLKAGLDPPLSAEEIKQILTLNVDDINVNPNDDQPTKFRSAEGFDWHFGYGRNNARKTVDAVMDGMIPPEVDIIRPLWFEVLYPDKTPTVSIEGRLNVRTDGSPARYDSVEWSFQYALGVEPAESEFVEVATGTSDGLEGVLVEWDITTVPLDLDARTEDAHQNAVTIRMQATGTLPGGGEILGEMRKGVILERDPDLLPGFPMDMGGSGESSPVFADLDGDGAQELVVPLADGTIHAFTHTGGEIEGWPVELNLRWTVDPANDRHTRGACFYRTDKTGCPAAPGTDISTTMETSEVRHTLMMAPAIGDLDADGTLEVIVATWDGYAYVFEHDGTLREGWPRSVDFTLPPPTKENLIEFGFFAAPTLWDLDKDGELEIIAPAMDQHLYVWNPDGSAVAPYPVKVGSVDGQGARIIASVAVGDADGDGEAEIAVGTSEVLGAGGNENEARTYLLNWETGEPAEGWPRPIYGLQVAVLPIVGRGVVSNPIMVDLDYDGTLEISFDTISTQGWFFEHDGQIHRKMDNKDYGPLSNSIDSPAYILMNNGGIGNIDGERGLDFVKGTAGFDFAIAFAGGGERKPFDHHMSGWDTETGKMMEGWPRVQDDWQFFNTPTIADIDNDNLPEVIIGSGGYMVRAWNYKGEQPEGWPKQTGGWIIASAAIGDFDGDQLFDIAITTRDGWLYAWKTPGIAGQSILEWNGFNHDPHNTGNYETSPTPYKTWTGDYVPPDDGGGDGDATGSGDDDATSGGPEADTSGGGGSGTDTGGGGGGGGGCTGAAPLTTMLFLLLALGLLALRRREG